jgi:hypothetical protein
VQRTSEAVGQDIGARLAAGETCPSQFQGQFFLIFVGMPAASFGSKIGDHLNTDHMAISSASYGHLFRGLRFSQGRPVTEPIG